ncbi:MAG: hypothetical protein WCH85_11655 [Methanomicrobiales archaeon]
MLVASGKNMGKTLEVIVLKDPCYIQDLFSAKAENKKQVLLKDEAKRLVDVFDRKAFDARCNGRVCRRQSTRCTVYKSDIFNPMWWCDACDPCQYGAGEGRIQIVRTYRDALDFAVSFGDPEVSADLIRVLAEAKGLSWPPGKIRADIFFHG